MLMILGIRIKRSLYLVLKIRLLKRSEIKMIRILRMTKSNRSFLNGREEIR
jgi:hypothetical protein